MDWWPWGKSEGLLRTWREMVAEDRLSDEDLETKIELVWEVEIDSDAPAKKWHASHEKWSDTKRQFVCADSKRELVLRILETEANMREAERLGKMTLGRGDR